MSVQHYILIFNNAATVHPAFTVVGNIISRKGGEGHV